MDGTANERTGDQGRWQSLPGVLTAVAGLITAVAGLILAASQAGLVRPSATKASAATVNPATISFPAKAQAVEECSYTITWARAGKGPSIKLGVQVRNRGKAPFLLTSGDFRLRANNDTSAPIEGPNQSIAVGATETGYVTFRVPVGIQSAELLIGKPGRTASFELGIH